MATERLKTIKSSGGDYTSLSAAEAGEDDLGNLVNRNEWMHFSCYAMEDTSPVQFGGWTTDSTRYILVDTPSSERHDGKWNANKYRLVVTTSHGIRTYVDAQYLRIDGLQIHNAGSGNYKTISLTPYNDSETRISNCILRENNGAVNTYANVQIDYVTANSVVLFWNNVLYDTKYTGNLGRGFVAETSINAAAIFKLFNNTFVDNDIGINLPSCVQYIRNNLIKAANAFNGTITDDDANNDYNSISENTNDPGIGSHGRYNQTFTFVDEANDDFHLASNDAGARDHGETDPGSGLFSDDIDGVSRTGTWDIGADEYPATTTHTVSCADGVGVGDSPSAAAAFAVSCMDGLKSGDGPSGAGNFLTSIQEGLKAGDTAVGNAIFPASVVEGIKLNDLPGGQAAYVVSASDGLSLSEALNIAAIIAASVSDGLILSDLASYGAQIINVSIADGMKAGDSTGAAVTFDITVADGVQIGEAVLTICQFALSVFDGLDAGDVSGIAIDAGSGTGAVVTFTAMGRTFTFRIKAREFSFEGKPRQFSFTAKKPLN